MRSRATAPSRLNARGPGRPRGSGRRPDPAMAIRNSGQHYGLVAMVLHWLMALLLIVLIALGLYMVSLPDAGFDKRKITLILVHKELGVAALLLVALRLAWRVGNLLPALVADLPEWQKVTAR